MIRAAIAGLGRWGRNLVEASLGHERLKIVRAVEPEIGAQSRPVFLGCVLADHEGDRIAGVGEQGERDKGHRGHDRNRLQNATDQAADCVGSGAEPGHGVRSSCALSWARATVSAFTGSSDATAASWTIARTA